MVAHVVTWGHYSETVLKFLVNNTFDSMFTVREKEKKLVFLKPDIDI